LLSRKFPDLMRSVLQGVPGEDKDIFCRYRHDDAPET
jgi:hypothetical protein